MNEYYHQTVNDDCAGEAREYGYVYGDDDYDDDKDVDDDINGDGDGCV